MGERFEVPLKFCGFVQETQELKNLWDKHGFDILGKPDQTFIRDNIAIKFHDFIRLERVFYIWLNYNGLNQYTFTWFLILLKVLIYSFRVWTRFNLVLIVL